MFINHSLKRAKMETVKYSLCRGPGQQLWLVSPALGLRDAWGFPVMVQAHLWFPWGPSLTTITKWPFRFPISGSSEMMGWRTILSIVCKSVFHSWTSQLGFTHSAWWILSLVSDLPFVLGSPLPPLHLFQERREVRPRKHYKSVQHLLSLCAKKRVTLFYGS